MKYSEFRKNQEIAATIEDMRIIKDQVETLFVHRQDFTGLDNEFLIANGNLPERLIDGDVIHGQFNFNQSVGNYRVRGNGTRFQLNVMFVSDNACPALATSRIASSAATIYIWDHGGQRTFTSKPFLSDVQDICFNDRPATHIRFVYEE
ncbi:hypothetical protein Salmuc_02125 [Salipiger mucosus DSM 16094]|uniref:Uncharacterized protein n=2 Tax=Salipiger mucosus TaxID=263378 RepID=S9QVC8_9RHOB|nr:hypothetical protein Salmuc_02125 [Salipiger mucosus DSM 16094]